ncbi:MAG: hypothetical protein HYT87_12765 [Nitrospirae bacterium]|nr:hypothetical protein [Nitrospirota bacterium]
MKKDKDAEFDVILWIVVAILAGAYMLHLAGGRVPGLEETFAEADGSFDEALDLSSGTARLLSDHGWFPDRYIDASWPIRRVILAAHKNGSLPAKIKVRCLVHLWRLAVGGLFVVFGWLVWWAVFSAKRDKVSEMAGKNVGEIEAGYHISMRPWVAYPVLRLTTRGRRLTGCVVDTVRTPEIVELCLEMGLLYASYPGERLTFGAGRDGGRLLDAVVEMLEHFRRRKWPASLRRDRRARDLAFAGVMGAPLGKLDSDQRGEGTHHFLGPYHEHKSRMLIAGLKTFQALPQDDRQRLLLWVGTHHSDSLPDECRGERDIARFICHAESDVVAERASEVHDLVEGTTAEEAGRRREQARRRDPITIPSVVPGAERRGHGL